MDFCLKTESNTLTLNVIMMDFCPEQENGFWMKIALQKWLFFNDNIIILF